MAKYIAMTKSIENRSTTKAQLHLIMLPIVMITILFFIDKQFILVGPLGYIIFITAYFNIKAYISPNLKESEDKFCINELGLKILTVVLGIVAFVLLMIM